MTKPVYFVDRCLGHALPAALKAAGWNLEVHDDHFPPTALDPEWLVPVCRKGWVILTKDKRLRTNDDEASIIRDAKGRVFSLGGGSLKSVEMVDRFKMHRARIERLVASEEAPYIFSISAHEVVLVRPPWVRQKKPRPNHGSG